MKFYFSEEADFAREMFAPELGWIRRVVYDDAKEEDFLFSVDPGFAFARHESF